MTFGGGLLGLIGLICLIWVLFEVWTVNHRISTGTKVIWTIAAIFFNILTAIVYYFMEKRR